MPFYRHMGLLWFSGKMGTLVRGIGNILMGALFKVVELTDNASVVKPTIVWWCIIVTTKQVAGGCRSALDLGTVCIEPKFLEDAVDQMRMRQVDCSIIVMFDIYAKDPNHLLCSQDHLFCLDHFSYKAIHSNSIKSLFIL